MFRLEAELRTRFRDPTFCERIQYPLTRQKIHENAIEDILDGTVYSNLPQQDRQYGKLHSLGSADGIKVFKSSTEQLWVVMLEILELPPQIRFAPRPLITTKDKTVSQQVF